MAVRAKAVLRYTADELCEVYLNENVHTEHVTKLALTLFDAVRPWIGMNHIDRRLLKAAARLHDIGYAVDPRDHAKAGVDIVREYGLEGFQERQIPYILAAIALHPNGIRSVLKSPLIRSLVHPVRGLRLGALLRIADGLDQSHVQDATIRAVHKRDKQIVVTVRSPVSPANLTRADIKASLWNEVFPLRIRFEPDGSREARSYKLLNGDENIYEAARRWAYVQYKQMRNTEDGVKAGKDPEPLHDFRVALRRFRALLRIVKKPLRKTWAGDIDRRLQSVGTALGPARDFDVWMIRLRAVEGEVDLTRSRVWKRYLSLQQEFDAGHRGTVRQVLNGARYRNLIAEVAYFLRVQLSELAKEAEEEPVVPFVAQSIWKTSRSIFASDVPGGSWEVEDFHQLRKEVRRARYLAEFFGDVLGPHTRRWGRTLKALADALGDLHDADVGLERVYYEAVPAPRVLVMSLRQQRTRALADVDAAWMELKQEAAFASLKKECKMHCALST